MATFIPPQRGEWKLAGGERGESLVEEEQRYAPRQGSPEVPAPLPGRISFVAIFPGVRLRSRAAKLPAPFQGALASDLEEC